MSNYVKLMLDSGVFAAWRRNDPIDLNAYIKFIGDHEHLLWSYVSLDAIPGSSGKTNRTSSALEQAAFISHKNQKLMRAAGLRPIPIHHQGEEVKWLDTMLDEGEPYIGLAPYTFASAQDVIRWLDVCYSRLCDRQGRPLVKTHGFGITSPKLLKRYPFFSIDSATWIIPDSSSSMLIPIVKDGRIDYTQQEALVTLEPDYDIDMRGPTEQEIIKNYLTRVIGASELEIRNGSALRQLAYIDYFLNLTKYYCNVQFKHRLPDLMSTQRAVPEKTTLEPWTLTMAFTTTLTHTIQNKALTAQDARYRLLSYYALKENTHSIEAYVKTGLCVTNHQLEL